MTHQHEDGTPGPADITEAFEGVPETSVMQACGPGDSTAAYDMTPVTAPDEAGAELPPPTQPIDAVQDEPGSDEEADMGPAIVAETLKHPYRSWDELGGDGRAGGILPCGGCGTEHADPELAGFAHVHDMLRRSAAAAGWSTDRLGTWCCPGCLDRDSSDAEPWPTIPADIAPGSELYDERLTLHVAVMKEISKGLADAAPCIHEHAQTGLHVITLHITDVAEQLGVRDRMAVPA